MPNRGLLPAPSPTANVLDVPSVMSGRRVRVLTSNTPRPPGGTWHTSHRARWPPCRGGSRRPPGWAAGGRRDQERHVDRPARAVARAVEHLHLDGHDVGV